MMDKSSKKKLKEIISRSGAGMHNECHQRIKDMWLEACKVLVENNIVNHQYSKSIPRCA